MGLTQSSVVQIICGDLGLDFLKCSKSRHVPELTAAIVSFAFINVSQGSVATQFRCGGMINNYFIANFSHSVPVEEFLPCDALRCTVFVIVILSVCLSHSWTVSTWFDLRS